jgi:TonB-linked SusC/RagA family outer membrane protein
MTVCFLLFAANIAAVAGSYSQSTLISLNVSNKSVKDVFSEIEKKSEYVFFYYEDLLDLERKVTLNVKNRPLPEILDVMFADTNNAYTIDDRQVFITQEKPQTEEPQKVSLRIEGTVTDPNGEPVIGVYVHELGTNNTVVTGVDGKYTIYNVASENSVLKFSFIGYTPTEVEVKKHRVINLVLQEDTKGIEEIIVVGYGTQKRASVIGAISTVRPSNLHVNQSRSLTNALAGQVSGIISVQRSGEPGNDASEFWIRGISSFGATGIKPLVLIDGIERNMENLSPEEIESFSLLKDATATAVYGVRGANGVLLIQTKRGQIGKPRVTLKADFGISNPTQLPSFVDGPTYMEVMNEAHRLSGNLGQMHSDEAIAATRNGTDPDLFPNVNWLREVTRRNVPNGRVTLDINGGTEILRYSLVVSTFSERGITVVDPKVNYDATNKVNRYNVRSNVDVRVSPSTTIAVSIGGYILNRNTPGVSPTDIIYEAFKNTPVIHPVIYSNGEIPAYTSQTNPWAAATQTGYISIYNNSLQSVFSVNQDIGALLKPLKGLTTKAIFSFDAFSWSQLKRTKKPTTYFAAGRDQDGNLITSVTNEGENFLGYEKAAGGNRAMYFEGQLAYDRTFNDHTVGALILYNMRDYVNSDATTSIMSLPYRTQGIAARVSYNFRNTYFIEGNFGYNGSENFQKNHRWGFFPSVAAGWMISNEPFMKGTSGVLSLLKLRGSYGLVGNDQLSGRRFAYLSTVNPTTGYIFGQSLSKRTISGLVEGDFGVEDLSWETVRKIDIGLEIGLFDAINIQADVFHERRTNIFMQRKTVPETTGFTVNPWANFGIAENRGFEFSVDAAKRISKEWSIEARGSFTFARNKIVEYDESELTKNTTRSRTNHSVKQYFGLKAIGLFQEEDFEADGTTLMNGIPRHTFGVVKPGDIRYEDTNRDGKVDAFDEQPIGKPYEPEIIYGFGASVRYKNIDLSAFFQGATNFSNMIRGNMLIPGSAGGGAGNIYSNHADRWIPEDPYRQVFWPRISTTVSSNNMRSSTWWLQDASYLRLKNLEVGYTFPKRWQNAARMQDARLFFRATNLFTWSVFKMWDPEIGSSDGLKYPPMKVYSVGFQVSF